MTLGNPQSATEKEILFSDLDLSKTMMAALQKAGYEKPTEIQARLIPFALDEVDVVGQAQTGTGKTAAFAIPILELLSPQRELSGVQALVLVPTRELAVQVRDEVEKLAVGSRHKCIAVYGGKPLRSQVEKLRRNPQVVVGTPGRVLDHLSRGTLVLNDLWCVVLDEADRMLDIGFRPDIEKILRKCPTDRQTILLSATVPPPIDRLAQRYMENPTKIDCSPSEVAASSIEQHYFTVDQSQKFSLLTHLLEREDPQQAIIFCRTKRGVDRLQRRLSKTFKSVDCIHGDMQQSGRDRVMREFRDGTLRLLVATDVVGRGIDVTGISHIVNFDIPQFCDDYVHRVGRTGRMGREGVAFTMVTPEEGHELTKIEQRINRELIRDTIPGFDFHPDSGGVARDTNGDVPAREVPSHLSKRPRRRHRRGL